MEEHYDIFISYRRTDKEGHVSGRECARILASALKERPKDEAEQYSVFFDYEEIKTGKFPEKIENAIRGCRVFLLILSKDALSRCANEDDWVRREIKTALDVKCEIINIVPDDPDDRTNTFNGWPEDLPEELWPIKDVEMSRIELGKRLDRDVDGLDEDRIYPVIKGALSYIIRKGRDIQANELYFDPQRANILNGFNPDRYFPRQSVDKPLAEKVFEEQRKYTILLGVPGSGKSRAIFQLLAPLGETTQCFAIGELVDEKVIVVRQDNVRKVLQWLEWEVKKGNAEGNDSSHVYLLCDQIKDVFLMLNQNEDLYRFFDLLNRLPRVQMIATSTPSAFESFRSRWKDYGHRPFEDDELMGRIVIPPISADDEEKELRGWIQNEWRTPASSGESIGDFIPNLNKYKQGIIARIYKEVEKLPYLPQLLMAVQIVETYRHDTALFLPVLLARKNLFPQGLSSSDWNLFHHGITATLNFLIDKNVIWVTNPKGKMLNKISQSAFSLQNGIDDEDEFIFDGDLFPETTLSTGYSYGVNEIVWKSLEQEDASRHLNDNPITLLKDFRQVGDVVRGAREFYRAFEGVNTLRRILPRIPRTDCYQDAFAKLWKFVYGECERMEISPEDREDFILTIGMLIGRVKGLEQIKQCMALLKEKGVAPNYSIIGELYSAGSRLGGTAKTEMDSLINVLRSDYGLTENSIFSLSREIMAHDYDFDETLKIIREAKVIVDDKGDRLVSIDSIDGINESKLVLNSISQLFSLLVKKADCIAKWESVFELYTLAKVVIRRIELRRFFSVVRDEERDEETKGHCHYDSWEDSLLVKSVRNLRQNYPSIIGENDKEGAFFYSIENARCFPQAYAIYRLYLSDYGLDNPRLVSSVLNTVRGSSFQIALNFLIDVDSRMKRSGQALSVICYNNLIKKAPNLGEALGVIPYLSHIDEFTTSCLLSVLKRRKVKTDDDNDIPDPKVFSYAYSIVMQDIFRDFRSSQYIIGLLFDLATTYKQESFIRGAFLDEVLDPATRELKKCELIDYSTKVASNRINKNYRSLNEVWKVFNTCRDHYASKGLFIASELYSNMMRKITRLLQNDEEELRVQMSRLRKIIDTDWPRIIRDDFFYPSLYRFMPDKRVLDDNGNISQEFMDDMVSSNVGDVIVFNNIMKNKKSLGFDALWKLYEYVIFYYNAHGRTKDLRPDIRTVTLLMEVTQTETQFKKVEEAANQWISNSLLASNKYYNDARKHYLTAEEGTVSQNANAKPEQFYSRRNYKKEVDDIINRAIMDISLYDVLTPSLLNMYLMLVIGVVKDIENDSKLPDKVAKKRATYWNVFYHLIDDYRDNLQFDVNSYVSLIKLSLDTNETRKWSKELEKRKEECKYNLVVCREMATSVVVARCDIGLSRTFFEYWERIMNDIGYDPADINSFSDSVEEENFWSVRSIHTIREMSHYSYHLSMGEEDMDALNFIKRQMKLFDQYGKEFPTLFPTGQVDFREEVKRIS